MIAPSDPTHIGRYRIEAALGRGAMGVVYAAHDPVIDRKVAIKLVRADLLDGAERDDYVARFQQEARAAGRCAHPNIVGVYDFALHDGNPYIAMEFIRGVALNQVDHERGGLTIRQVTDLVAQALDGLGAAHALGVVHRDIKPANIMLADDGRVKVTDFGISRIESASITGAGAVIGTPSYMSPEQCRGETVDARSDIFSTGVVLYELVTGQKPFAGKTQHEVWRRLLEEDPVDVAILRPDAPEHLVTAIRRALGKRPEARFTTAGEMAAALRGGTAPPELDRTVIAMRAPLAGLDLDGSTISAIERQLARYVGPIAGYLVRNAARGSDSVEALRKTLASAIDKAENRALFSDEVRASLSQTGIRTGTAAPALGEADLERARQALTRHLGPVARVLVKRSAVGCGDAAELWRRLAQHIDQPKERGEFMRQMTA